MPYLNKQQVMGNLGRDPEMRYTPSGQAVTQASVAATRRYQKNGEWTEQTEWFRIVIWGESGERFAEKMHKGDRVFVEGRTETREYEDKEGGKKRSTELIVQLWQDLEKRSNRDAEDGDERPSRRTNNGGGSRQQKGDPPSRGDQPPADDLSDLGDLPFS